MFACSDHPKPLARRSHIGQSKNAQPAQPERLGRPRRGDWQTRSGLGPVPAAQRGLGDISGPWFPCMHPLPALARLWDRHLAVV